MITREDEKQLLRLCDVVSRCERELCIEAIKAKAPIRPATLAFAHFEAAIQAIKTAPSVSFPAVFEAMDSLYDGNEIPKTLPDCTDGCGGLGCGHQPCICDSSAPLTEEEKRMLDAAWETHKAAAPAPAVHQGVCYREGPPTPEDYDEAIIDLMNARNQRISMARGEFQGGCAVCGDSGHTVNGCHHDPLQLARERARQKSTWQCYHCGFEARTDEDAIEHFGRSEEEVARCLRPAPAVPVQEEAQNVDNFSKWYSENEDGLPSSHKYACEAAWNAALAAPAVQWTDEQVERARKKLWVNEVFAGPKLVRAALEAASKDV